MSRKFELMHEVDGLVLVKRYVKFEEGERLVDEEKARRLLTDGGSLIGYELLICKGAPPSPAVARAQIQDGGGELPCSGVLSRVEVEAVIGMYGQSQTKGMSDWMRDKRIANKQAPEDLVELAEEKLKAFTPRYGA